MGPLYQSVLDQAERKREQRIVNLSSARLKRLRRFFGQPLDTRWTRTGRRVVLVDLGSK